MVTTQPTLLARLVFAEHVFTCEEAAMF